MSWLLAAFAMSVFWKFTECTFVENEKKWRRLCRSVDRVVIHTTYGECIIGCGWHCWYGNRLVHKRRMRVDNVLAEHRWMRIHETSHVLHGCVRCIGRRSILLRCVWLCGRNVVDGREHTVRWWKLIGDIRAWICRQTDRTWLYKLWAHCNLLRGRFVCICICIVCDMWWCSMFCHMMLFGIFVHFAAPRMWAAALHTVPLCVQLEPFVGSLFCFISRNASTAPCFFMLFQHELFHIVIVLAEHRFGEGGWLLTTAAGWCTCAGFARICYAVHLNITLGTWITSRTADAALLETLLHRRENAARLTDCAVGIVAFDFHGLIGADGRWLAVEKPTQVLVVVQLIVCRWCSRWALTIVIVVVRWYFTKHHRTTFRCRQLGLSRQV